MEIDRNITKLT